LVNMCSEFPLILAVLMSSGKRVEGVLRA